MDCEKGGGTTKTRKLRLGSEMWVVPPAATPNTDVRTLTMGNTDDSEKKLQTSNDPCKEIESHR